MILPPVFWLGFMCGVLLMLVVFVAEKWRLYFRMVRWYQEQNED